MQTMKQTTQKQLSEVQYALLENQERLDAISHMAKIGYWEYLVDERRLYWTKTMFDILECDESYAPQLEFITDFSTESYRQDIMESMQSCLEEGIPFCKEIEIETMKKQVLWFRAMAEPITENGQVTKIMGTIQDIHLRKETEKKLQQQKWLMQAVVENIPHMVFVKEASELRHLVFNKAGEQLTGIPREDFLGKNAFDLFPEKDAAIYAHKDQEVFNSGVSLDIPQEPLNTRKKGIRQVHTKKIPIFNDNNKPIYLLGICEDITKRLKYEEKLKKAKEKAQAANEAKSQFLANMSHEIRTPMNGILGYLELALEKNDFSLTTRDYLYTAHSSAKSLLLIINDILDFSKIEVGKLRLEYSTFKLSRLLRNIMNSMQVHAHQKQIDLKLNIHPSLFVCISADQLRLRQVLTNLIGNAIKFTEQGHVTVCIKPDTQERIQFSISDTGIGLSKKQLKKIFSPFVQADDSTTRRFGGTGLGTTISNQLVELMGGSLNANSPGLGHGSTFTFTIPMQIPACYPNECDTDCDEFEENINQNDTLSARHFNILLAEDLATNANLAIIRLKQRGHKVEHVWNGAEAIQAFQNQQFDAILMDVHMPDVDGISATQQIRQMETGKQKPIPIIALTASLTEQDRKICIDAGMDAIAGKPLDIKELFDLLENTVPAESGNPVTSVPVMLNSYPEISLPENLPGINIQKALKIWTDPKLFLYELLRFGNRFGDSVVKIQSAIAENNIKEAHNIAHALKGVAGNLALESVFNSTSPLNDRLKKTIDEIEATNAEVKGLVHELDNNLKSVNSVIEKLNREYRKDTHKVVSNPKRTRELLHDLCEKLDEYNPSVVQSQLEALISHLEYEVLDTIVKAVAEFDFDKAKLLTIQQIKALSD